jgi:uncharacterized membrane protein YdbT with pleckstrin-like domain
MSTEISPAVSRANLIELLKKSEATTDFSEEEIVRLADRATFRVRKQGETIVKQGEPGREFFLVLSGQVRALDTSHETPRLLNYHWQGQFFGERALLTGQPRSATVDVVADAEVAVFDHRTWEELLIGPHPRLRTYFETIERRYEARSNFDFPGRQWDEVAVINTNRHPLALLARFIGPTLMTILGLGILVLLLPSGILGLGLALGGFLPYLILVVGWYVYELIDWVNDDFIVSNKRVIHIERTILSGEQRYEAPLSQIQDVTLVTHGFISRLFDYYDLRIQTAGAVTIVFDGIRNSYKVQTAVFEERQRAIERIQAADLGSIREALATRMEWNVLHDAVAPIDVRPADIRAEQTRHLPRLLDYLIPRMREVNGNTILWRKHFFILLKEIALPTLALVAATYLLLASFLAIIPFSTIDLMLSAVLVAIWTATAIWYLWQYDDWRKDVYIVSEKEIVDVQSSAFRLMGEKARRGTFDTVQNINFESPNFFARLINMGTVTIETAGTAETFTFEQVFKPREVQQEVFKRWVNFKEVRRRAEREAEEARFTQWLYEYDTMRDIRRQAQQFGDEERTL